MLRKLRQWTDWINVGAAVLLGVYLVIMSAFNWNVLVLLPQTLAGSGWLRALAFLVGLAIVLGNGILIHRAWRAGGLRENLRLNAPDGVNMLAPDALEHLFLRTLKEQSDLRNPRVALEVKSGQSVALHLRFGLREQADVVKRMEEIKGLVREQFLRMLPEGVNLETFVEVVELVSDGAPAPLRSQPKEFDGPVYSDGDDGEAPHEPLA